MVKKEKRLLLYFIVMILVLIVPNFANAEITIKDNLDTEIIESKIGIGGGGALFEPAISPHNSKEMLVVPDMGGIYVTHDNGLNWIRSNLHGTVYNATYDPNREGVIYAGGSGLWRSTDNGDTFELIFPNKNDITAKRLNNGNSLQYYFTKSGIYDRNRNIKAILIDPEDSNHIFALAYNYKNGIVYESTDNGENFERILTYTTKTSTTLQFDFNDLIYRRETKDLFVINNEFIMQYNLTTKEATKIYEAPVKLVDVTTVYEDGKTYFIIIEKVNDIEKTNTIVYYTNDFENKVDLTDTIIDGTNKYVTQNYKNNTITEVGDNYFVRKSNGKVTYKYDFAYISATSLNNIYLANWTYPDGASKKEYSYIIDGIIRYHDEEVKYLFGNPFYDHNYLSGRSWNDGCTYALGIAASMQNEDEFAFTTLCGINYASDNEHIYARHTTLVAGKYPNSTFVTNGIDEQKTYGVCEDPFHEGVLLLLNTDLGLIRSEDNGKSWSWIRKGIPSLWQNTIYDAEYDKRREGVVYSLWSGRHNAPYNASNETDNRNGGFAISTDGGKTWDSTYSSGLPENSTPVKMSIIYEENSEEVTIYVATFNCGFYVSHDSGKTFQEMNNGIEKITYKEDERYHYILAEDIEVKDGHIYGLTAKTTYNGETQPGKLYEYIDGKWENIPLPKNAKDPIDIYYKDGIVYLCGTAASIWDGKNGVSWNCYAGGVYAYENGEFIQIFDESISTSSVVFDSRDTMYISDMEGNIYRKEKDGDYERIYANFHYKSDSIQVTEDDDRLYLSTHGGGMLKLENLNSLYKKDNNFKVGLSSNKESVEIGDEVVVKVNVSDISEKIIAITGKLEFDTDKLEVKNVKGLNSWDFSEGDYNINNFRIVTVSNELTDEENDILEVTFKVKENAKIEDTTIKLSDVEGGTGKTVDGVAKAENTSLMIKIDKVNVLHGDVDLDGNITINDLAMIKLHIIEKEILNNYKSIINADMDKDRVITINDLALLKIKLISSD